MANLAVVELSAESPVLAKAHAFAFKVVVNRILALSARIAAPAGALTLAVLAVAGAAISAEG